MSYPVQSKEQGDAGTLIEKIQGLMSQGGERNFAPFLPLFLRLKGKPYGLDDHFPFEPFFDLDVPPETVLKTGRQCGKSNALAAKGLLICATVPHFSVLYITPLFEQIRRFSTQYLRPFIETSPLRSAWVGPDTENSVLQRSFCNFSKIFCSYAFTDAERIRGIPAELIGIDEIQNFDPAHLAVVKETLAASHWRARIYSGTAKTLDTTLHWAWTSSSQAEWCIPCLACGKINIPAAGYDLERMIGPVRDDISEDRPGIICANSKCGSPISPRLGRWVHKAPALIKSFPGYHIPQIILPVHYAYQAHWAELVAKMNGYGNTTTAKFYNECLGESYDQGTKLVNITDLIRAGCLEWENANEPAPVVMRHARDYDLLILAVDWGGGGEDRVSLTTLAVMGIKPSGQIDVIYGRRLLTPHDHLREAEAVLEIWRQFGCRLLVHDYTGAGALRETFLLQAGLDADVVVPVAYIGPAKQHTMTYKPATPERPRAYWQVDKPKSLGLTCACIKLGLLRFFRYDFKSKDDPGLLHDFLALIENKTSTAAGSDIYTIIKSPMFTDDFAQAVNIGCCALWQSTGRWPDLAAARKFGGNAQGGGDEPGPDWRDGDAAI